MASQVSSRLGANLKRARRARGLTQRQLAESIGTDSFQISRWERGENRPRDETLHALADELGRDLSWFYLDHEDAEAAA